MISSKKLQHILFFIIFLNCCIVFIITCVSLTTEHWAIIKPYRQIESNTADIKKQIIESLNSSVKSNFTLHDNDEDIDYSFIDDDLQEEKILDLSSKLDCKRFQGLIRFGLFNGVSLLNYAFGCKYRLIPIKIIEALSKDKIFDQTLWICTILCCSLSLFTILLSGIFSLLNAFLSPSNPINGPLSLYLWSSLSLGFNLLGVIIYSAEFYFYINKNVLTKEQIESGWTSTGRAELGWSFYILFISAFLILVNIGIVYFNSKYKRSLFNIKNIYQKNENLIADYNYGENTSQYFQVDDTNSSKLGTTTVPDECVHELEKRPSKKLGKIIDFIY